MIEDHFPIPIEGFKGFWDRGQDDTCPLDHFITCQNFKFPPMGVETRNGFRKTPGIDKNIVRFYVYKRPDEVTRLLIMDNTGAVYDSTNMSVPIVTAPGATDFSMVTLFGRAYLSPHNGVEGLPNASIHVYDGTTVRIAGGVAPSVTFTVVDSPLSGNVEAGLHYYAVSFETASGYVTKPSGIIGLVSIGYRMVTVGSIPIGPAGTVARHILATKLVSNLDGDPQAEELYFLERIPDNITVTKDVNFYDTDLQASADYLQDQRDKIPACLYLTTYKNRMIGVNYDGGNSVVLVSKAGEPESFSEVDGFLLIDPSEAGGVKTAVEFRDSLYIFKSFRCYVTQDLTGVDEPVLWSVISIDKGIGTEVYGIARIQDSTGTNNDKFLVVDRSGLLIFDGVMRDPPLTQKIHGFWQQGNVRKGHEIQVFNIPGTKELFISFPIGDDTKPSVIIYGDYSDGLDTMSMKWSVWKLPVVGLSIGVDIDTLNRSYLRAGSTTGGIYNYLVGTRGDYDASDNGIAIDQILESSLIRKTQNGEILHFGGVRFRINGNALLTLTASSEDGVKTVTLRDLQLAGSPGAHYFRMLNFSNEKMKIRIRSNLFDQYFQMLNYTVFAKDLWLTRPNV